MLSLAALTLVACSSERERPGARACVSWQPDVAAPLAERCGTCHGGESPAGDYDVESYLTAIGPGSDGTPNAVAGDGASRLLAVLEPDTAAEHHRGFDDLLPLLREWVVECELSYDASPIHAGGIMNPADADFHGRLVAAHGYDFGVCADCHGADFSGGTSGASCQSCHTEGPTACSTCHGNIGDSGAHGVHLAGGALERAFDCSACHVNPTDYTDPGHIFAADGSLDPSPVEVVFGALAAATPPGYERAGPPSYDRATQTCSNVYCHGDVFGDGAALNTTPVWMGGPGQATCGTCHGTPPASHADDRCSVCHPTVVRADGTLLDPARHVDGVVDVGDGPGCGGCHGRPGDPAPPPDLAGNTSPSIVTVGAHRAHVGARAMRGPIPCGDCHRMPTELHSPGHIDTPAPAEVFPGPAFAGLAAARGAEPEWHRPTETCAGVYCHGEATVVWTEVGTDQAVCGSCHGIPPVSAGHTPDMTLHQCVDCHAASVNEHGGILVEGPPGQETSRHINGIVDFN